MILPEKNRHVHSTVSLEDRNGLMRIRSILRQHAWLRMLSYGSCHMTLPEGSRVIAASPNSILAIVWIVMIVSCWISEFFPSSRPLLRYGKLLAPSTTARTASIWRWVCHPALYVPRSVAFLSYYALFSTLLAVGLAVAVTPYILSAFGQWEACFPSLPLPSPLTLTPSQGAALAAAGFLLAHALRRLRESTADARLDARRRAIAAASATATTASASSSAPKGSQQHVFVALAGCIFYCALAASPFIPYGLWNWALNSLFASSATASLPNTSAEPAITVEWPWAWAWTGVRVCVCLATATAAGWAQARAHDTLRALLRSRVEAAELITWSAKATTGRVDPKGTCSGAELSPASTPGSVGAVATGGTTGRAVATTRDAATLGYSIPHGGWFAFSSSPHYLAEMILYAAVALAVPAAAAPAGSAVNACLRIDIGPVATYAEAAASAAVAMVPRWSDSEPLAFLTRQAAAAADSSAAHWAAWAWGWICRLPFALAVVWVVSNLTILARDTHQWYLKQFGDKYPASRAPLLSLGAALAYARRGEED